MKRILSGIFILLSVLAFSKVSDKKVQRGKNNKLKDVELVFILDRSGSMQGLESDTIGGYNSMLLKQKKEKKTFQKCTRRRRIMEMQFHLLLRGPTLGH